MIAFQADKPLPRATDPARANRTLEELAGMGFTPRAQDLPLLNAAFGNSPYLSRLAIRAHEFLQMLLERGADHSLHETFGDARAAENAHNIDAAMATLRIAKRRAALAIAFADISGAWSHHEVTGALTKLANCSISASLRFLLRQRAADTPVADLSPELLDKCTWLVV